jgi:leucyl-tRNA synthetase
VRWQGASGPEGRLACRPLHYCGAMGDSFVFAAAPFTSGNIHLGHVRSYTIADVCARFRRAQGDAVLFAIGFDAFGLPAELKAIEHGEPIAAWVERCRRRMRAQLDRLGFSFDWEREFVSSDPDVYRWSQWLFLTFLDAGLVYRAEQDVDWCEACATVLARPQVLDGACWRCHGPVRTVRRAQWHLRGGAYAAENDARLGGGYGDRAWEIGQRKVLGRVDGVELDATAEDGRTLTVFTPHADAVGHARFVALSPRHPELDAWVAPQARASLEQTRRMGWSRADRHAAEAPALAAGRSVRIAGVPAALPVVISPLVDPRAGITALLGIPSAERGDALIAQRLGLPVHDDGDAAAAVTDVPVRPAVRFRPGDVPISRQRCWGTPIPVVHCPACGVVPVPRGELPVRLPRDLQPTADGGNPLEACEPFVATTCPRCAGPAARETDTLDCHFDGLWLWLAVCVPPAARASALFEHEEVRRWLPGRQLVWGADGGQYIFDLRATAKALRDAGPWSWLADGEPFSHTLVHEMVQLDGEKMSKHLGNVVDPDALVAAVGADAVRLAVLGAAAPRNPLRWTDDVLRRSSGFVSELWDFAEARLCVRPQPPEDAAFETSDHLRARLARWCAAAIRRVTEDVEQLNLHRAADNVVQLLAQIQRFEARALQRRGELEASDAEAVVLALRVLIRLLAPMAPHVCDELWTIGGCEGLASELPWPAGAGRSDTAQAGAPSPLASS